MTITFIQEEIMRNCKQAQLRKKVAPFESSDTKSSIRQLVNTFLPFIILWFLAYKSLTVSYCLTRLFATVAAGFVMRSVIIFHECTDQPFFKRNRVNRVVDTITAIHTLFPYEKWKRNHAIDHATICNLDKH